MLNILKKNKSLSLIYNTSLISKKSISSYLNKEFSNIDIYTYKITSSTNELAKKLALSGAKHGTVIIAEEQTKGKGRMGRTFYSPPNTGIYMSIILRPNLTPLDSILVTTSSSVLICDAIYKVTGIDCQIKWINDIYINNKKVGGILIETSSNFKSENIDYLILGIGINLTTPKNGFPNEIKESAGYLYDKNNNCINKNILCAEILNNILSVIPNIKDYNFIPEYKKRSIILNKEILYKSYGNTFTGKAIDITKDGSLVIKHKDDTIKILNSSEISIRNF